MSDGGPLVLMLTPNPENISKIKSTASLALILKKYHANLGVNRMKNGTTTAAFVKHKCYSFTIIMYYLKGTSRGPQALQSHLNDSYYTNVLC